VSWSFQDDPVSGARIMVNSETGKARLTRDDGEVYLVPADQASRYIVEQGYRPAGVEDVQGAIRNQRSTVQKVEDAATAAAIGLARGGASAITAMPALAARTAAATGRAVTAVPTAALEAAGATQAAEISRQAAGKAAAPFETLANEVLPGGQILEGLGVATGGVEGGTAVREAQQHYARTEPGWTTAGEMTGAVAGGILAGGGIAGGARGVVQGGIQGSAEGVAQVQEDAYLRGEHEARGEQYLAGGALGALLGAGIPLGLEGLGAIGRGARRAVGRGRKPLLEPRGEPTVDEVFSGTAPLEPEAPTPYRLDGGTGKAADDPLRAPQLGTETASHYQEVAQRVLGVEPEPGVGAAVKRFVQSSVDEGSNVNRGLADVSSVISGGDRQAIEQLGPLNMSRTARAARAEALEAKEAAEKAALDVTDKLREMDGHFDDIADEVVGDAKIAKVGRLLDPAQREQQMVSSLAKLDEIETVLEPWGVKGSKVGEEIQDLRDLVARKRAQILSGGDAESAFEAMDELKRLVQRKQNAWRASSQRTTDAGKLELLNELRETVERNVHEPARQFLEDEAVWGRAGQAQKAFNAEWHNGPLRDRMAYERTYTDVSHQKWDRFGGQKPVSTAATAKVTGAFKTFGTARGRDAEELLLRRVKGLRSWAETAQKHFEFEPAQAEKIRRMGEIAAEVEQTLTTTGGKVRRANQLQELIGAEGQGIGGVLGLLTDVVARPGTSAVRLARLEALGARSKEFVQGRLADYLGDAAGRGVAIGKAIPGAVEASGRRLAQGVEERARAVGSDLLDSAETRARRLAGDTLADAEARARGVAGEVLGDAERRVRSGISEATEPVRGVGRRGRSAVGRVASAARATGRGAAAAARGTARAARAGVPAAIVVFGTDRKARKEEYRTKAGQVTALASNPDQRLQATESLLAPLDVAPKTAAAVGAASQRAISYLHSMLPVGVSTASLTPHLNRFEASDAEIARWGLRYQTVANPMSVFDDLERGTLTWEQVETLQAVYPRIYSDIQAAALDLLADRTEPVPYRQAAALDLLLGLNGAGHPSLSSGFLARIAQLPQQTQQPKNQPRSTSRKPQLSQHHDASLVRELA
jgi:hypothetical protein